VKAALQDLYRLPESVADALAETGVAPRALPSPAWSKVPAEALIDHLRLERYMQAEDSPGQAGWRSRDFFQLYYKARPLLGDGLRRKLQRAFFRDWKKLPFPGWPVDTTVEALLEEQLAALIGHRGGEPVPFIWFWPGGAAAAAMMTHDVETAAGLAGIPALMETDAGFGVRTAFQIVPESRYAAGQELLREIRASGCEVNVHGLDHDGNLFDDYETFRGKAGRINQYIEAFQCAGFRSPSMYRNVDWLQELRISYDMSVPNTAHLEPQRGGCCTVFPFYAGRILELPLTLAQDYSLFHILGEYSTALWRQQIDLIRARHGLISVITHPDYLVPGPAMRVYRELLEIMAGLRDEHGVWLALPGEIHAWWRDRSSMRLVRKGTRWSIEGPARERARVALASLEGGKLVYRLDGGAAAADCREECDISKQGSFR
jgi:hypothetical protein